MTKRKGPRQRPSTPNLKLHQHTAADPASPPETPTTSPLLSRKSSLKPRHQPPFFDFSQSLGQDPSIRPVGDGHQFSYQPNSAAPQLSPRSSSSSSSASVDQASINGFQPRSANIGTPPDAPASGSDSIADQDEPIDEDEELDSESSEAEPVGNKTSIRISITTTAVFDFIIEDIDPMDSDCDGLDILLPTEIESNRSQSRSPRKGYLDTGMMQDLKNLNCSNEASDNDEDAEDEASPEEVAFRLRQKELKRIRKLSMSSSFGKRTYSELSDSDDDDRNVLDMDDPGFSARHMRKRLHRGSLLFQDPPAPRIDELEEPDSSEDEPAAGQSLARELPFWTIEIMEVDSS